MRALILLVLLLPTPAAQAQGVPTPPKVDFAVTYRILGQGDAVELKVAHSAGLRRQRLEGMQPGMVLLIDMASRRATMLEAASRSAIELPAGSFGHALAGGLMMEIPPGYQLTRTGTDRVAGTPCTVYRVSGEGRPTGTACVTESGVLLRAGTAEAGERGGIEAVAVSFATQPASLFEVPAGYRRIEMPAMPPGLGGPPGGAPGGPPRR